LGFAVRIALHPFLEVALSAFGLSEMEQVSNLLD
jgi:hypothetical protein